MKAKTKRDDELVRLVVLLRLLFLLVWLLFFFEKTTTTTTTVVLRYLFAVSSASVQSASSSPPVTPSLCINNLLCFLTFFPCLSLFSFFLKGFPTLYFFLPTLPNSPSCLPPFLFIFHVLLPSPFPSCSSLLYSPLNSSWLGCWDEGNDELAMAFFPLFFCSCSFSVFPWAAASLHRWRRRNC
jgi:hypothetical protein